MRIYDLIAKKRDGVTHTREELEAIVNGFVSGEVADYQMAAWMMAFTMEVQVIFWVVDIEMKNEELRMKNKGSGMGGSGWHAGHPPLITRSL